MSLFSKAKTVLWPKEGSLEVYLDSSENNTFSFENDLWSEQSEDSLRNLATFFQQSKIKEVYVLLSDTYVHTKTFVYDSVVTTLDPNEVVTLAKDSVDFKISAESVTFDLEPDNNRTLVRTRIFNQEKLNILLANVQKLGLKIITFETVSSAVAKLYSHFDSGQFFFFYSLNNHDYLAILVNKGNVYLTSIIKKTLPELKKLLNYASAYFSNKEPKQYFPNDNYNEAEICQRFNKATNLPLPALSFFASTLQPTAIIKPTMENNTFTPTTTPSRNLLPIIAVFILTAAAASVIVWFILNQNSKNTEINNPTGEALPTVMPTSIPEPTPTLAEIDKNIKVQVLNATEINGQAATVKAELTKLGFKNVATGNSSVKQSTNEIQLKTALSSQSAYFKQSLSSFATASSTELKSTSTYDVVIIIGVDLSTGTSAPVATTTPKASVTPKATPTKTSTPSATPTISR